jgi:large subunit ribosomal protein L21
VRSDAAEGLGLPSLSIRVSLRGFFPRKFSLGMAYAIIKTGGRQYRVAEGETIDVDLLDVEAGKTTTFGDVLMYADGDKITHGSPIDGAKVTAEVVEQRKDKKVIAFKYRRRKGYHRTVGHRRRLTRVKIKTISVGAKKAAPKKSE